MEDRGPMDPLGSTEGDRRVGTPGPSAHSLDLPRPSIVEQSDVLSNSVVAPTSQDLGGCFVPCHACSPLA